MATEAPETIGVLAKALEDPDAEVRVRAAIGLYELGVRALDARAAVSKARNDADPRARRIATEIAGAIGGEGESRASVLARGLADRATRLAAARGLGRLGWDADEAVDALVPCLEDPDARVREAAAFALCRTSGRAREPWRHLARAVGAPYAEVRGEAAQAFHLTRPSPELLPTLIDLLSSHLRHTDPAVRRTAVDALSSLGSSTDDALNAMVPSMCDPDETVRWGAVHQFVVRKLTPPPDAVTALRRALEDPSERIRGSASCALALMEERLELVRETVERLRSGEEKERALAARSLWELFGAASGTAPALLDALSDSSPLVRLLATRALGAIAPRADVLDGLIRALGDPDASVRKYAAAGLGEMRGAARPSEDALLRASRDATVEVRNHARSALELIRGRRLEDRT